MVGSSTTVLEDVENAIAKFRSLVADQLRDEIVLSSLFQVRSSSGREIHWPKPYVQVWGKNSDVGVYIHFDEQDRVLYVGQSVSVSSRLAAYFKYRDYPRDKSCIVIDQVLGDAGSCGVRVIFLDGDLRFFAPALEWFLIEQLDPPVNKQRRVAQTETDERSSPQL